MAGFGINDVEPSDFAIIVLGTELTCDYRRYVCSIVWATRKKCL